MKRLAPRQHELQTRFIGPFRVVDVGNSDVTLKNLASKKIVKVHKDFVAIVPEAMLTPKDNKNVDEPFPMYEDAEVDDLLVQV